MSHVSRGVALELGDQRSRDLDAARRSSGRCRLRSGSRGSAPACRPCARRRRDAARRPARTRARDQDGADVRMPAIRRQRLVRRVHVGPELSAAGQYAAAPCRSARPPRRRARPRPTRRSRSARRAGGCGRRRGRPAGGSPGTCRRRCSCTGLPFTGDRRAARQFEAPSARCARLEDRRARARSRRCACARARPRGCRPSPTPIGLPYFITGLPCANRRTATLCPRGIGLADGNRSTADVEHAAGLERFERRGDVVARLMTSAGAGFTG